MKKKKKENILNNENYAQITWPKCHLKWTVWQHLNTIQFYLILFNLFYLCFLILPFSHLNYLLFKKMSNNNNNNNTEEPAVMKAKTEGAVPSAIKQRLRWL